MQQQQPQFAMPQGIHQPSLIPLHQPQAVQLSQQPLQPVPFVPSKQGNNGGLIGMVKPQAVPLIPPVAVSVPPIGAASAAKRTSLTLSPSKKQGGKPPGSGASSVGAGGPRQPRGASPPGGGSGDLPTASRGPLLEELRNNRSKKFELSEVMGSLVEFCGDQHGSRFIQQQLETCSAEDKQRVFEDILPHSYTLMEDVYGNYVIQKFFDHGAPEHVRILADHLRGHMIELSMQMYGCRVIQKALESVDAETQTELVAELHDNVLECVKGK